MLVGKKVAVPIRGYAVVKIVFGMYSAVKPFYFFTLHRM